MKKLIPVAIFALMLTLLAVGYENVFARPFPFLDVTYEHDEAAFNAPPEKLPVSLASGFSRSHDHHGYAARMIELRDASLDEQVRVATEITRSIQLQSKGMQIRRLEEALSLKPEFRAICSEGAKIFTVLMEAAGRPARVIWMQGHTVSEVWNGSRWLLVDTHGNVMATDRAGAYLSTTEVIKGYHEVRFVRISDIAGAGIEDFTRDGYLDRENAYSAQSLYMVVGGTHLFGFHENTRKPVNVVLSAFNIEPEQIGYGLQYLPEGSEKVGNVGINFHRRLWQ